MSAKSTPWVFPEGVILPVVSQEVHPLKRFGRRLLIRGIVIAGLLHLAAFGGWLAARTFKPAPPPAQAIEINIKKITSTADLGVPPSLSQADNVAVEAAVAVAAAPSIGVPEPVPDFQATTTTLATVAQISQELTPIDPKELGANQDSLLIDPSIFDTSSDEPVSINSVQELPVPINTPSPVYPDLARSGDVEGQVRVQALITRDGKVAQVRVIEGNLVLHEAAVAAVKQWTFKPALQQHKPVAVWVEIPLDFSLDN